MHHRQRIRRRLQGLAAAAMLSTAGPAVAHATDTTRLEMQLRDGRLSAHVVAAPFTEVLAEIASLSGASVIGVDPADVATTTIRFRDLPLADALERLLRGRSYLLLYGNDRSGSGVRRIVILNGGTTALTPAARTAGPAPAATEHAEGEFGPDHVDPALADALRLLASGIALDDPAIRRQLLDEIATWPLDAPARPVLLARLCGDPDPDIREAALLVLQDGRPDVSATLGIRKRRHDPSVGRAQRARHIEGQAAST